MSTALFTLGLMCVVIACYGRGYQLGVKHTKERWSDDVLREDIETMTHAALVSQAALQHERARFAALRQRIAHLQRWKPQYWSMVTDGDGEYVDVADVLAVLEEP